MKASAIKILIVDDDEDDFFIISEYIRQIEDREFVIDWCNSFKEATDKICGSTYDLYFIDYLLGARTGLGLIRESIENDCEEPFILLTGNGNPLIDRKAMESGAVDYLVKNELSAENWKDASVIHWKEHLQRKRFVRVNENSGTYSKSRKTVYSLPMRTYYLSK